jgi:hypothetical protein
MFDKVIKSDFQRSDQFNGYFRQSREKVMVCHIFDQLLGCRQTDFRQTDLFPSNVFEVFPVIVIIFSYLV